MIIGTRAVGSDRNAYIDTLRGGAILVVIFLHYCIALSFNFALIPADVVTYLTRNGYYGVTIFFVISGFLITSRTLKRYGSFEAVRPRQFYRDRFARIAPLLIATVAVLTILHLAGVAAFMAASDLSIWTALWAALTFQFNWYYIAGAKIGLFPWGPLWSLSIEEMFYVFFPIAGIVLRKTGIIVVVLLILIAQAPFARIDPTGIYMWSGCADAIAMGCLAAIVVHHTQRPHRLLLLAFRWLGLAGIVWQYLYYPLSEFCIFGPTIIALGSAVFLFGASTAQSARRFFLPIEFMGRRSYEIYLIHMPLLMFMRMGIGSSAFIADALLLFFIFAAAGLGELIGTQFTDPMNRILRSQRSRPSIYGTPTAVMKVLRRL